MLSYFLSRWFHDQSYKTKKITYKKTVVDDVGDKHPSDLIIR